MSRCLRDEQKKPRSLTQLAGHSPVALMRGAGDATNDCTCSKGKIGGPNIASVVARADGCIGRHTRRNGAKP